MLGVSLGDAGALPEINDIIRSNGLRNTAGPSYAPRAHSVLTSESAADNAESKALQNGRAAYPELVSVTVEGPLPASRHYCATTLRRAITF